LTKKKIYNKVNLNDHTEIMIFSLLQYDYQFLDFAGKLGSKSRAEQLKHVLYQLFIG